MAFTRVQLVLILKYATAVLVVYLAQRTLSRLERWLRPRTVKK
ncbi:MAG TPA: hypothetical protein VFV95_12120 [Vicinamibacterales bacterium]|nr:hypothetical protein [Vicinamibacterales bacterium]